MGSKLSERIASFFGSRRRGATDAHMSLDKKLVLSLTRGSRGRVPSFKQLKHLPRYLSPKEKKTVFLLLAAVGVSLLAIGGKFASEHVVTVADDGGEYVEASIGSPRFANPLLAASNDADVDIVKLVFSGLMRTTTKGELVDDLAVSHEVSEDGKTYTFVLRDNLSWHDGTAFSARDVAATISYIKEPAWKSPLASQFKNVTVEAPDDKTVKFTLEEPFAPFLSLLTVGIVPEHLWQDVKPENAARAELNLKPVGTGPFKFKSFTKDKKGAIRTYTLARNDAYYGDRPHLDAVSFRYYPDFASAEEALTKRKVDGLSFLPLEFRDAVEKLRSVRTYTLRLPQYTAVFFNQKKNAHLRAKEVRQALAQAVDRDRILRETLGDNGVLVHGPILAGFVGFHPDVKKRAYDLAAASELLDKEGWKLDETDGIRKKTMTDEKKNKVQTPLAITLTTVDAKENITVAQLIKRDWESIGVKTELEIVPGSKIQKDKIRGRDYDALLYGEIVGPDPDPYPFWHSSQNEGGGLNLAIFSNRRVDELLEKARAATKSEEREPMYKEFQDILAEEAPAVFLYSPTYTYAVARKVGGIETGTIFTPADRFGGLTEWFVETKRIWQ